ncbi:MAG: FGGY-family carbohydrate kinase [Bacteroidota bacterium]
MIFEATAFGAKAINDRFAEEGVAIERVIAMGGIAKKNDLVMQTTADVLGMPIEVAASDQACALGAAMFGATAAGSYRTIAEAQKAMGCGFSRTYRPDPENTARYREVYRAYLDLGGKLGDILRRL